MAYDTDKAAAKRHDGHAAGNALHQHILNRGEGEPQVRLQQLEDGKAHQAGRHRHDGHPARLEAEVHVGRAYHGADAQASSDTAHGEAAALGGWRGHGLLRVPSLRYWKHLGCSMVSSVSRRRAFLSAWRGLQC